MCHKCAKVVKKLCQHILILSSSQFSKEKLWQIEPLTSSGFKNKIHPKAFWGVCSGGLAIVRICGEFQKMTQKSIAWGVFATHKQATDGATFYSGSQ